MDPQRPHGGLVGAAAVILTLVGVLAWAQAAGQAWRLGSGLLEAGRHLERGRRALEAGSLKRGRLEILGANAGARDAQEGLRGPNPLLDIAALVPAVQRAATELPHLVKAATRSAAAGAGTLEVAQTALRGPDKIITREDDGGGRVRLDRIEALQEQLSDVRTELDGAGEELRKVDPARLPRRARAQIARGLQAVRSGAKGLADAEAGLRLLPAILGANGPRWYLIGMQNNAELRGPGGALLRFALLRLDDGDPTLTKSSTVYHVDVDREPIDIPLPKDAWYVREIEDAQRFGNANWSPDWPSAAKLTVAYGRASKGKGRKELPPIAGVLAVDPSAMQSLLPGVGSITTRGGRTLARENIVPFLLHKAYGLHPGAGVRRAVLIDVVERFYERLLAPRHPTDLLQGFGDALARKHMQIWLSERREQRYVERMNWDGGIEEAETGDYLYVVEQNVGGNKLNYVERQSHVMDVRFSGPDAVVSTAIDVSNDVVLPQPGYWLGDSEGFHRPMLNVYVPERARLMDAGVRGTLHPQPAPAVWVGGRPPEHFEHGKKVWSATLEIPPQRKGRLMLRYRVPHALERHGLRKTYRLTIQHQPKVRPEALTVRLALPPAARALRAPGWERSGRRIEWRGKVEEDMVLRVSWR